MNNAFYLIRFAQIIFKFGIILLIPNFLDNNDLANYGFINTLVNIFIILYGLELWYFYNRDTAKRINTEELFTNQYNNYLLLYIIFIPFLFFLMKDFNTSIIILTVLFSIISHFVQEIVRSLIHLGKLTESAVVNITQSIWIVIFLVVHKVRLENVLTSMLLGTIFSLMLGIYFLQQLDLKKVFNVHSFSFGRLKTDTINVRLYLFSSLCMRLALSVPVLIYKYYDIENSLVVYSYYFALATGMEFFVYHFIQAKFIAKLVYNNTNNKEDYIQNKKVYFIQNIFFIILLLVGSMIFCSAILPLLINNKLILESIYYGGFIMLSMAIMNFSNYYAIILYTQHNDHSNVTAPPISFLSALILSCIYYVITGSIEQIGYVYILIFSIILSIIRYIYWFKFDNYEKKSYIY